MDRSTAARTAGPIALFAAVLAGVVALNGGGGGGTGGPRPLPVNAGAAGTARTTTNEARTSDSTMPAYHGGELVFRPGVTAGLPGEGPSYALGRDADLDRIAKLARALGVEGDVRTDEMGWVAGSGNRVLRVVQQAGLPWHLSGPEKPVVAEPAPAVAPCSPPPDGRDIACLPPEKPAVPPSPPSPPAKPSEDEARRAAQPVFDAIGLTGTIAVHDGWDTLQVTLDPVVGGLPTTGYGTGVAVDAGGKLQHAYGSLAVPRFEARYPLLSPEEAAKRGTSSGARPLPAVDTPCADPCTGAPEPYETPKPREVVAVRLGLMMAPSYDTTKDSFLVPAWLVTVEGEHGEQALLALPDRYLATPPPASHPDEPVCDAEPCPTKGTTDPGSSGGGSSGSTGGTEPSAPPAPDQPADQPAPDQPVSSTP